MRSLFLSWLFYGHVWIALAACALSWQSTYLAGGMTRLSAVHCCVCLGTLGVYTLHRLLSYRRAGSEPDGRRYRLVATYPTASLLVGLVSLVIAAALAFTLPIARLGLLLLAVPFTLFYLIPIYPGGPRLRDLPYLKVVWVAVAWTLVTHLYSLGAPPQFSVECLIRFCLTLAIALLFDTRDVQLDRRQGVRTLAADYPVMNRTVALGLLLTCALLSVIYYPGYVGYTVAVAYLAGAALALGTKPERGEDFYAVYVNGLLLLPPISLCIAISAAP